MVPESDVINFASSNESELRTPGSPSVGVTKKFHYGWSVNFTSKKNYHMRKTLANDDHRTGKMK